MLYSVCGRRKFYRVWQRQDGLCSVCQNSITTSTPWGVRHIVKRTDGGSDAASNLQMQHLSCRRNL
ncbi:MAG: HNH endonuclease [Sulfuritalea sp.]|nr:HNH endonuclease [Sulfuritalea sp.]